MDQFRPHRLHGAVQFGPGFDVRVESGVGFNWDIQAKWWLGTNVCERTVNNTEEEVTGQQLLYSRTCTGTGNDYRCTTMQIRNGRKTVSTTVYECCPGFTRSQDEHGQCTEEVILSDTATTLQTVGVLEMARALNVTGMFDVIEQRNYTVFAPTDEAFNTYEPLQDASLRIVRVSPESVNSVTSVLSDIVSGHLVPGLIRTNDFVDDQLYETSLKVRTIRLNKYIMYPQPILTANCVPLLNADVMTTNGVVHVVERVLPTTQQTLEELVLQHPQLTIFATVAHRLGLSQSGSFTLFAPSDDAFHRLNTELRNRLLSAGDCELEILRQHILPHVVCSASVTPGFRVRTENLGGRFVTLSHAVEDSDLLVVDGANTTDTDVMATNGVLHIVDDVLFVNAADKLVEVAKTAGNVNKFLRLIEQSNVGPRLNAMNNFTLFLPTDDAVKAIGDRLDNMSAHDLQLLVENHVVQQRLLSRQLYNDQQLPTLLQSSQLQIKHYHSFPFGAQSHKTVQCATFRTTDINDASVCSGVGHIIDRVLLPPAASVLDALMSDRKFSSVMQLLKTTGLTDRLQQQDSSVTFFAPTNQAFESLPRDVLNALKNDTELARHVLLSHMLPNVHCCAGVFRHSIFQMPVREVNLDGWMISVDRSSTSVNFGNVPVVSCDQVAINGVVHVINKFAPSAITRYITRDGMSLQQLWNFIFNK